MKIFVSLLMIFLSVSAFAGYEEENAQNYRFYFPKELSDLPISDWKNPALADYGLIQDFLKLNVHRLLNSSEEERALYTGAKELGWITYRMNKVNFIHQSIPETEPVFNIVYFNNDPQKKDKCIVCYTSFSESDIHWNRCIKMIIGALKINGYNGHFLYRVGGWPSLQRERLKYADVPYSFKPFGLEEARDLGYENILWVDACVMPLTNLEPVFNWIKDRGCGFVTYGGYMPSVFLEPRKYLMHSLGYDPEQIIDVSSRVIGISTKHPRGNRLLDLWLAAAEKKLPFCEPNGDQLSFAAIVNMEGFLDCEFPRTFFQETGDKKISKPRYPDAQLSHQIALGNPTLGEPDENDLFEK